MCRSDIRYWMKQACGNWRKAKAALSIRAPAAVSNRKQTSQANSHFREVSTFGGFLLVRANRAQTSFLSSIYSAHARTHTHTYMHTHVLTDTGKDHYWGVKGAASDRLAPSSLSLLLRRSKIKVIFCFLSAPFLHPLFCC